MHKSIFKQSFINCTCSICLSCKCHKLSLHISWESWIFCCYYIYWLYLFVGRIVTLFSSCNTSKFISSSFEIIASKCKGITFSIFNFLILIAAAHISSSFNSIWNYIKWFYIKSFVLFLRLWFLKFQYLLF